MQAGESSISPSSPGSAGRPPPPTATVGNLEITVEHRSICWDTTPSGDPAAHEGATVTLVPASGANRTETTDTSGIVRFVDVPVGTYRVDVSASGYTSGSASGSITAGGNTQARVEIEIDVGPVTICNRQHTPRPTGAPGLTTMPVLFWHDAFMIWARELAWIIFMVAMVVTAIIAIVNYAASLGWHFAYAGFGLPIACFGVVAYLVAILFGQIPGIIMMVLAGLSWLTLLALAIATAAGFPLLPLDYVWIPVTTGMWTSFFVFLAIRMTYRIEHDWPYLFVMPLPAIGVGLVLFLVINYMPEPDLVRDPSEITGLIVLNIVLDFVFGLLGGLSGHVFRNDGAVEPYTVHGERKLLPFAGERYCVQGNRGWFSHYLSSDQERCYDFAVPEGSHVLAIEEGHVIEYREDRSGSAYDGSGNNTANYVHVQHRDGSVAHYLHLRTGGVSAVNTVLVANSSTLDGTTFTSDVHVHAGQVLAEAGSTGISRFPHIHLGLYTTSGGALGLEFRDLDVQRHGGRCFTFRKYLSQNPDNGSINV